MTDKLSAPDDALAALLARHFAKHGPTFSQQMRYDLVGTRALLAALGHPEDAFASVLLVGTNGKGSCAALTADALTLAGYKVGRFTSPHLVDFGERITFDGVPISVRDCARWLTRLEAIAPLLPRPYSFFEGTLAMAAGYFAERGADIVVFEAGLGGRLDATNAMPSARVAAVCITPIGLDHQATLGHTVAAIAEEKAAVIRPNVPVVSATQDGEAAAVVARMAAQAGAPLTIVPSQHAPEDAAGRAQEPKGLRSPFQRDNAALAEALLAVLGTRGFACPERAIATAKDSFRWPGRYQWLPARPTPRRHQPWLIDAGHNPHGTAALAAALQADPRVKNRQIRLLFGALADKPIAAMLAPLLPLANEVHVVPCPSARSHDVAALLAACPTATAHAQLDDALDAISGARSNGRPALHVACGSLSLVGAIMARLCAPNELPPRSEGSTPFAPDPS